MFPSNSFPPQPTSGDLSDTEDQESEVDSEDDLDSEADDATPDDDEPLEDPKTRFALLLTSIIMVF
jgi:hypothetical protein